MFEKSFNGESRELQGYLRGVQRLFQGVSRQFQGSFEKVLRQFRGFIMFFKNVSMKFCFATLLWHESHRSYLSRRRACFFWKFEVF